MYAPASPIPHSHFAAKDRRLLDRVNLELGFSRSPYERNALANELAFGPVVAITGERAGHVGLKDKSLAVMLDIDGLHNGSWKSTSPSTQRFDGSEFRCSAIGIARHLSICERNTAMWQMSQR